MVTLVDDSIYEEEEEFRLLLGTPKSESPFGASIGEQKETLMKIKDLEDSELLNLLLLHKMAKLPKLQNSINLLLMTRYLSQNMNRRYRFVIY